jgi:hypothetical protein
MLCFSVNIVCCFEMPCVVDWRSVSMCGCTVAMAYVTNICECNLTVRNVTVKNVMLVKMIKIQFKIVGNHEF